MNQTRDAILRQIGLRIVQRREALGLRQKDLAERLGVAQTAISPMEHGERNLTIDTICRLADALETTFMALIGGTEPPAPRDGER
jgi:transcriptional regulator with XRE-family HTH domain